MGSAPAPNASSPRQTASSGSDTSSGPQVKMQKFDFRHVEHPTLEMATQAINEKEYEAAAVALLKLTQYNDKALNEKQAWEAHAAMRDLQRRVALAMDKGDPKARAAAELLKSTAAAAK